MYSFVDISIRGIRQYSFVDISIRGIRQYKFRKVVSQVSDPFFIKMSQL